MPSPPRPVGLHGAHLPHTLSKPSRQGPPSCAKQSTREGTARARTGARRDGSSFCVRCSSGLLCPSCLPSGATRSSCSEALGCRPHLQVQPGRSRSGSPQRGEESRRWQVRSFSRPTGARASSVRSSEARQVCAEVSSRTRKHPHASQCALAGKRGPYSTPREHTGGRRKRLPARCHACASGLVTRSHVCCATVARRTASKSAGSTRSCALAAARAGPASGWSGSRSLRPPDARTRLTIARLDASKCAARLLSRAARRPALGVGAGGGEADPARLTPCLRFPLIATAAPRRSAEFASGGRAAALAILPTSWPHARRSAHQLPAHAAHAPTQVQAGGVRRAGARAALGRDVPLLRLPREVDGAQEGPSAAAYAAGPSN